MEGLGFPHAAQAVRIRRHVTDLRTGKVSWTRAYAVTSLPAEQAKAARLGALVRGHWAIEAHHHIRDTTFAEDACKLSSGHGPANLAALLLSVLERPTIPDAIRWVSYECFTRPLDLIGIACPARIETITDFESALLADQCGDAHLGPSQETPVLHVVKGSQPKLSAAALCCYRPENAPWMTWRTRLGWYHGCGLIAVLDEAHQVPAAPVILVWDNLAGHRSRRMRRAIATHAWLEVKYPPAYASELNPAEGVWAPLRNTVLACLAALSFGELTSAVRAGLRGVQRRPDLVADFLARTGLQLRTQ